MAVLDKLYLAVMYTGNTTFGQAVMELNDCIDETILKKAVETNLKTFAGSNFSKKLVIHKNDYFLMDNHNEAPVFRMDDAPKRVCSEDTNQYPFYVAYEDNKLKFVFAHFVSDGTGMYMFMDYVVKTYLRDRYPGDVKFDGAAMLEDSPFETIAEPLDLLEEQKKKKAKNKKVFYKACDPDGAGVRSYIKIPEEKVLELAKAWGITPVGLIIGVFSRALRNVYEPEDASVVTNVMVDLRRRTGIYPLGNFSGAVHVAIDTDEFAPDLEADCKNAGSKLEKELGCSYYNLDMNKAFVGLYKLIPGKLKTKIAIARKLIGDAGKGFMTYVVSYMKLPEQPDWYMSRVKDMVFSVHTGAIDSATVAVISQNGVMTWQLTELADRKKILSEVSRMMGEYGIDCEITESRDSFRDYLDIDAIEQMKR